MAVEKITSFTINHDVLEIGMYISRVDGDIVTYDVRMVRPNCGVYPSTASMHTIEHLFATYARNSRLTDHVVYVGPMGCRTGFYLLTRGISHEEAIQLVKDSFEFILTFEGPIPGAEKSAECGNYLDHDLAAAKRDVLPLVERLRKGYTPADLVYKE